MPNLKSFSFGLSTLIVVGFLLAMVAGGCNDHTFVPQSDIKISPNPIKIENQGGLVIDLAEETATEEDEEEAASQSQRLLYETDLMLIDNRSITADLSIFELTFYDEENNPLTSEPLLDANGVPTNVRVAKFGEIREDQRCDNNSDCASRDLVFGKLAPYYVCISNQCQTDISFNFRVEFDLGKLVVVDQSVMKQNNLDKAAIWQDSDGSRNICYRESADTVPQTLPPLYGLNACDRLALERKLRNIDDDDLITGYDLVSKRKANLRLMMLSQESDTDNASGQITNLVFSDAQCSESGVEAIQVTDIALVDPLQSTAAAKRLSLGTDGARFARAACGGNDENATEVEYENPKDGLDFCLLDNGEINEDMLSVDIDALSMDQLPIKVVYAISKDVERSAVLSQKTFKLKVSSSATIGGGYEKSIDVDIAQNLGGPPEPIITVEQLYQNPEPLTDFKMSGLASCSPFGDARKPFTYQWSWAPGGRPAFAQDAILVCDLPNNPYNVDNDITRSGDEYTDCGETKIFFPIVGTYTFRLKVLDSANQPSGPTAECPDCPEYDTKAVPVKPSKKLYVELVWDKGGDGIRGVDMDLFLVRKREDGSFSVPMAYNDMLSAGTWNTKSCNDDMDCTGGFHCDMNINFCDKACTSDQQCFDYAFGYYCNMEHISGTPQCALRYEFEPTEENPNPTATIYCGICSNDNTKHCGNASDCCEDDSCTCTPSNDLCATKGGYCSPWVSSASAIAEPIYICTEHPEEMINDTCSFQNTNPEWGDSAIEDDNPSLDIDDVDGYGPETITLKTPVSGTYRVIARMFSDPLGDVSEDSPVKGFIKILINGEKVQYTDPISGEVTDEPMVAEFTETRTYWKVADIVWDADAPVDDSTSDAKGNGEVTPLDYTPITSDTPAADLGAQPYANPFRAISGPFDPKDCTDPRSIWCDEASTQINSTGETCDQVYASPNPPWCN